MSKHRIAGVGYAAILAATLAVVYVSDDATATSKVTICHAAGLAGTTHYVTLTIGYPAVYGPAGHFYENGTPRAGHEQDYLGACKVTPPPSTTTTVPEEPTTTTTVPQGPTTTTTTPPPTLVPPVVITKAAPAKAVQTEAKYTG